MNRLGVAAGPGGRLPDTAWAAVFYFAYLAAIGATAPFIYLVYRQHGLSPAEIGVVIAVSHVMNFITAPLWGAASDLLLRRSGFPLLPVACLGAGASILALLAARGLPAILAAVVLWGFFAGSIISLADAATLAMLAQRPYAFGQVRVWGSAGGVAASLGVGLLGDRLGLGIIFPAYTLLLFLCAAVAFRFPRAAFQAGQPFTASSLSLLRRPAIGLFLLAILCYCIGYMGWRSTFSLYLEDLGGSPGMIGTFFALSSLVEIPVAAASALWLRRWGERTALGVAFAAFALLWLAASLLARPALALPLALVHGMALAFVELSGVIYISRRAPQGYANLAQGAYGGVNRGVGSILGSLLGGSLYGRTGGPFLYRLSAALGVLALGILLFLPAQGKAVQPAPLETAETRAG